MKPRAFHPAAAKEYARAAEYYTRIDSELWKGQCRPERETGRWRQARIAATMATGIPNPDPVGLGIEAGKLWA